MISKIKGFDADTLIESESHRKFLENFESDLLRGIGKISLLKIIKQHGNDGVYGYKLLKELKQNTKNMLIIKEGTLYPLLRNLENWTYKGQALSLIKSRKVFEKDRPRKYYHLTSEGEKVLAHLEGFFVKLLEGVAELNDFQIILNTEKYIFCHNCKNKIEINDKSGLVVSFCEICGYKLLNTDQDQKEV